MSNYEEIIDEIFSLMQGSNVALFIGAGFSISAGLPSGKRLKDMIVEKFFGKDCLDEFKNSGLSDAANQIIYRSVKISDNQSDLFNYLQEIFIKENAENSLHNEISNIPYIKDIITTNYDNIFELVFGSELNVIYDNGTFASAIPSKINLYKIHGDIKNPNTIILSDPDYAKFIAKKDINLLADKVKELFATKNIVFIGFSFDDININTLYQEVRNIYDESDKKHFFITPNEKPHKVNMLESIGITYIDATAEIFVSSLVERMKKNLLPDLQSERINYKDVKKVTIKEGFIPEITSQDGLLNISKITPTGETEIKFKGVIQVNKESSEYNKFKNIITGESLGTLTFSKGLVNSIRTEVQGFLLNDYSNITKLIIRPHPIFSGKVKVKTENINYQYVMNLDIYFNNKISILHLSDDVFFLHITNDYIKCTSTFKWSFDFDNLTLLQCVSHSKQIVDLLNSNHVYVFIPNKPSPLDLSFKDFDFMPEFYSSKQEINFYMNLFQSLIFIEQHFNIQFNIQQQEEFFSSNEMHNIFVIYNMIKEIPCDFKSNVYIPIKEDMNALNITIKDTQPLKCENIVLKIYNYNFLLFDFKLCPCSLKQKKLTEFIDGEESYIYVGPKNLVPVLCSIKLNSDEP